MRRLFERYFKDSETILWARLQMLAAAVIAVLATIDPMLFASYIPTGYLPIYIFVSGVITVSAKATPSGDGRCMSILTSQC